MSVIEIVFHWDRFYKYYNCCAYEYDSIPLQERRHIVHAVIYFVATCFIEAIYIPCLWAIYHLSKERNAPSCYHLMLYLGVVECIGVSLMYCAAYVSFNGFTYCSLPVFIYTCSQLSMSFWCAESIVVMELALNRCMVTINAELSKRFFAPQYIPYWLALPTICGILLPFFAPPNMYSTIDGAAFFNPHQNYLPDNNYYHSDVNIYCNWFLVLIIIFIYLVFSVAFFRKVRSHTYTNDQNCMRLEWRISVQVCITCSLSVITTLGFIYMEYIQQFAFFLCFTYVLYQGTPAMIYLTLNQSIRNHILYRTGLVRKHSAVVGITPIRLFGSAYSPTSPDSPTKKHFFDTASIL